VRQKKKTQTPVPALGQALGKVLDLAGVLVLGLEAGQDLVMAKEPDLVLAKVPGSAMVLDLAKALDLEMVKVPDLAMGPDLDMKAVKVKIPLNLPHLICLVMM
jgi:hypothetical protein